MRLFDGKRRRRGYSSGIFTPQLQAAFFDLDGTLVLSEEQLQPVLEECLSARRCDFATFPFVEIVGQPDLETARRVVRHFRLEEDPEAFRSEYKARLYERMATDLKIRPGADTLVQKLLDAGLTLGLVTSAPRRHADIALERVGLRKRFRTIVTCDTPGLEHRKPHPNPYLLAARKLDVKPWHCVAFEDTPSGAQSARDAAMIVVGAPHEFSPREQLVDIAHHIIPEGQTLGDFRLDDIIHLLPF